MKRKLLIVLTWSVLITGWALAQDAGADLDKLRGTWQVTGIEAKGKKVPADILAKNAVTITFDGNKYTEKVSGEIAEQGTVTLHADKSPRHIDILIGSGQDKGKTQLGIYKLEGDTFTIAISPPDDRDRPTSYTTQAESKFDVQIFQRDKK